MAGSDSDGPHGLPAGRRELAAALPGFLPDHEAQTLYEAALHAPPGPLLEIGTYCGKSAIWLGSAAQVRGSVLFTVDHHRGSEEHQPGWEYHDPMLIDQRVGRMDTLPTFRRAMASADLEHTVVAIVGASSVVSAHWSTPLAFVFIDGGHTDQAAAADYTGWSPHVVGGGVLAIHDVFEDPSEGGRAPHRIWKKALESRMFTESVVTGSLRVLRRR